MAIDLNKIVKGLKKNYSDVAVVEGSDEAHGYGSLVSTGNKAFDIILDGGVPFGHSTEFLGLSQDGKSLFCQLILKNAQDKFDAVGIVVDRENSFTDKRATELGINTSAVIKAPAKDTQLVTDAFNFIFDSIDGVRKQDKEQHIVVIIDSISAFDKDTGLDKADAGRKAKNTKECLRALLGRIDNRVMVLIVNQFYFNIGQMYGDPKVAGGGEGLKYFNTIRIGLDGSKQIIDTDKNNEVIGAWITATVFKTRMGPCHRKVSMPFYYDTGIPYYGGYARLLAHRNYLRPKNKNEFNRFKQTTLVYERDWDEASSEFLTKNEINEHKIEQFLQDHEDLVFDYYPIWREE